MYYGNFFHFRALNFGYDFVQIVHFLGHPVELDSKRSKSAHERILRNGQKRAQVDPKNGPNFLAIL